MDAEACLIEPAPQSYHRDAGVLFYAKVIEDYIPPDEAGEDSAQQLSLTEGELVAVTADHGVDGWYGGYRLADSTGSLGWFSSHFVKQVRLVAQVQRAPASTGYTAAQAAAAAKGLSDVSLWYEWLGVDPDQVCRGPPP
jgi:hypothetical protein